MKSKMCFTLYEKHYETVNMEDVLFTSAWGKKELIKFVQSGEE